MVDIASGRPPAAPFTLMVDQDGGESLSLTGLGQVAVQRLDGTTVLRDAAGRVTAQVRGDVSPS